MSREKRKGTAFESAVVAVFNDSGFDGVERRASSGAKDKGDIAGVRNWTLECKDHKSIDLASFVDEAEIEAENAGTRWYAAIVKRRRKNASKAYVVIPLDKFVELLREYGQ